MATKTNKSNQSGNNQITDIIPDTLPLALMVSEIDSGKILIISKELLKILGFKKNYFCENKTKEPDIFYRLKNGKKVKYLLRDLKNKSADDLLIKSRNGEYISVSCTNKEINYLNKRCLLTVVSDIHNEQVNHALNGSGNSYLEAIIENQPGLIWLKDTKSRFLSVNSNFASSCGIENRETVVGKSDLEIWPLKLAKKYRSDDQKIIKTGKPLVCEEQINDRGTSKWFETFKIPVFDEENKIIGTAGYARDITKRRTFEEDLKQSESKYRMLFESSPVSLWEEDFSRIKLYFDKLKKSGITNFRKFFTENPDKITYCLKLIKVLDINPATLKLYDCSDKESIIKNLYQFLCDESRKLFIEEFAVLADGATFFEGEFCFMSANGKKSHLMVSLNVVPEYKNTLEKVIVSIQDVTRIKQAELSLKLYEYTLECINEIATITDFNDHLIYVNNSFIETYGFTKDEIIGKHISIIWSDSNSGDLKKRILADSRTVGFSGEVINRRKNGEEFPIYLHSAVVKTDDNNLLGLVGIAQDITLRKQQENELRTNSERLRLALEVAHEGILDIHITDGSIQINDEYRTMMGYNENNRSETLKHWIESIHPEDKNNVMNHYHNYISGQIDEYRIEFRQLKTNGEWMWVLSAGKIIEYSSNIKPLRMLMVNRDISELKTKEEEILQLNANLEKKITERTSQLSTFAYTVSHDLRAPIRAINGFAKILSDEYSGVLNKDGIKLLNVIRSNTLKMDQLITDLLSLSRVSRTELKKSRISMQQIVTSVIKDTYSDEIIEKFNISVYDLPDVYADPNLMKQVWVNLISNAIKFTMPVKVRNINIGFMKMGEMKIYFINDTGVRFNPENIGRLFSPFQRLHSNDAFEGNGIGLSIVKQIIEHHDGKIWAESEEGKGAAFYFSIP